MLRWILKQDRKQIAVALMFGASLLVVGSASAQVSPASPHPPVEVTVQLTDLVTMLQWVFGLSAGFLIIFAGLCIIFFGVDIRDARNQLRSSIDEARKIRDDASDILTKLKSEYRDQQDQIRKRRNELDDTLRDARNLIEKLRTEIGDADEAGRVLQEYEEPKVDPDRTPTSPESDRVSQDEAKRNRIREIIKTSKFEWTTIGRVMKGTGLSHNEITELVQNMPDIKISKGRKTQDTIFRFRQPNA